MSERFRSEVALTCWAGCWGCLFLVGTCLGSEVTPVTRSSIRESVAHSHDAIISLAVRYVRETDALFANDPKRYQRLRFLAKRQLRLRETLHSTTQIPEWVDLNHITQILTQTSFDYFVHNSRYYEVSRNARQSAAAWKLKDDEYLEFCGWWPSEDDPPSQPDAEVAIHLRFVLENPHYSLLEPPESVEGHPCVVLDNPGIDRLWLDPELGFVIRKRELYDDKGAVRNRKIVQEFQPRQVVDASNESLTIWFPTRLMVEYQDEQAVRDRSPSLKVAMFHVEELTVNELEDDRFVFTPPPGTVVYNKDDNSVQQLPGGYDLLDENIAQERERKRLESNVRPMIKSSSMGGVSALFVVVGLLLCFNIACYLKNA